MATIFIFDLIITIDKNLYVIYNVFYNKGVFIMSNENQKDNKENFLTKFLKAIHEYYIFSFIFLFSLSIIIFAIIYICHSKNIENRFNNTLQNYEKSMSAIFNNMVITNGNNENIYTNSFQTNNEIRFNNKIENLKLSFEVGFKMLESSMNEIMKNSNDILQFWFAFLSVIMIVFTLIGFFLNNNILNQTTKQLEIVKIKSKNYINKIKRNTKAKNNELIKNIKLKSEEETNKLIQKLESEYNQTIEKFKEENNELIENIKIKTNEETEKLIKELEDKYNEAIKDINKRGKEEGRKIEEESDKKIQENNLFNLGFQAYNNKDYKTSEYYFTKVIELNLKNSGAYHNRGLSKHYLKDYDGAIKDYKEAIKIDPNYAYSYGALGLSKHYLKDYDGAIKDYNEAIRLNPSISETYNNRGAVKYDLANTKEKNSEEYNKLIKEAIEDYNKAIELNPNYSEAYNNRGLAKLQLGKIEEAIKDFVKAYELSNNNIEVKEKAKNRLINLANNGNEFSIEFCKKYNINYNDN